MKVFCEGVIFEELLAAWGPVFGPTFRPQGGPSGGPSMAEFSLCVG
jgi:hypothetical protein